MSNTFEPRDDTLSHGAWKKHKYIRKEGKKYIYKESTKHDDGTVWDKYVAEDGSAIHKQSGYKYDPERPDYRKGVIDKAKEVASKITDKEDSNGEMAKGDYVDEEEKKKKYFVKHSDDSLAHSLRGSQRANHKYSARKWVNGKWRYFYGKIANAVSDPGSAIGTTQRKKWKYYEDRANVNAKSAKEMSDEYSDTVKEFGNKPGQDPDKWRYSVHPATIGYRDTTVNWKSYKNIQSEKAKGMRRTAYEIKKQYDKTPLGKIENASKKGAAILKKFFSGETKVTVKDTFTGETRTPKQTGNDAINIKELSEKNKKKNTNKKVKYLKDGSKVTIETSTYSRRSR